MNLNLQMSFLGHYELDRSENGEIESLGFKFVKNRKDFPTHYNCIYYVIEYLKSRLSRIEIDDKIHHFIRNGLLSNVIKSYHEIPAGDDPVDFIVVYADSSIEEY